MTLLDWILAVVTAVYALWMALIVREVIRCRKPASGAGQRADLRRDSEPSHKSPMSDPHLLYSETYKSHECARGDCWDCGLGERGCSCKCHKKTTNKTP